MRTIRVMRLWRSPIGCDASAVWTGSTIEEAWKFLKAISPSGRDGRLWIDDASKPAYPGYGLRKEKNNA